MLLFSGASFDIERLRNERFGFHMRVVTCEEGEREKKGLNRSLHSTNVNALKTSFLLYGLFRVF